MNEASGHGVLDSSFAEVGEAVTSSETDTSSSESAAVHVADSAAVTPPEPLSDERREEIREGVVRSLHRVYDPEIPVNIFELGLIYDVAVAPDASVEIQMTLTSPHCPVAGSLPGEVEMVASTVEGTGIVTVLLTWDPPWTPERMSEAARLELNFW